MIDLDDGTTPTGHEVALVRKDAGLRDTVDSAIVGEGQPYRSVYPKRAILIGRMAATGR